jgi:hypothetical protein
MWANRDRVSILFVLQVMQISVELVTPAVQKKFNCLGKDKRRALRKPRREC